MKIINLEQRSKEWHQWRSKGIGSSDIAAIMGKSPYKTRRQLFTEKYFNKSEDKPALEFIFEQGKRLEDVARKDLHELYGVDMEPICAESSEDERFLVSVDLWGHKVGGAEVKLIGHEKFQKVLDEKIIPEDHYIQCNWQMMVCNRKDWIYFCGTPAKKATLLTIARDDTLISIMKREALQFMNELKDGKFPALSDKDWIEPESSVLFDQLRSAKVYMEEYVREFDRVKEKIINTYSHNKIKCAGVKVYQDVSGKWVVKIDKNEGEAVNG
jgi:putative phage-type endonuclease